MRTYGTVDTVKRTASIIAIQRSAVNMEGTGARSATLKNMPGVLRRV
jgi:hypothetical protein